MHEVLDRHLGDLRKYPGVLNVAVSTKFVDGKDTGVKCVTVYVAKKLPLLSLAPKDVIPNKLEDVAVDVVELNPTDWKIGPTEPARKNPRVQRRIAGGVRR